jgi:hypothetical protein
MPCAADGALEIMLMIISVAHLFYVCNSACPTTPSLWKPAMGGTLVSVTARLRQ